MRAATAVGPHIYFGSLGSLAARTASGVDVAAVYLRAAVLDRQPESEANTLFPPIPAQLPKRATAITAADLRDIAAVSCVRGVCGGYTLLLLS